MVSRATFVHGDESPPEFADPPAKRQRARPQKDKGKGKKRERDIVKVKEEPPAVSLSEHGPVTSFVSIRYLCYSFCTGLSSCPT